MTAGLAALTRAEAHAASRDGASSTSLTDGSWELLTPPGARESHSAIYDPVRDRMVVFGGFNGFAYVNDVWALSLAGTPVWTALTPTGAPPIARYGHSAIYDPVRDRMVVFGGWSPIGQLNDVWALSLAGTPAWVELTPAGAPPSARYDHNAIYDPVRDHMVVFGGDDGLSRFNDVWVLSLAGTPAWTAVTPTGTPPIARYGHSAIWDPVRDRMVVFGGFGSGHLNDVWVLSLAGTPSWTAVTPGGTPPSARGGHSAIYDPVRDRMVVLGGYGSFQHHNDVWALSLAGTPAWTAVTPTGTPPIARYGHSAIYDPVRDRMAVFGGYDGASDLNDVWALSLAGMPAWTGVTPAGEPPGALYSHSAVYDPVRDRMLVFGGNGPSGCLNDVWALSLSGTLAWTAVTPAGAPPIARSGHSAIYDPLRDCMVVFGGHGGYGSDYLNDVWTLSLAGTPAWTAVTPTGTPPIARAGQRAICDPVRDRMVVFGGAGGSGYLDDVWVLSLAGAPAWTVMTPTGTSPVARYFHSAIYDPVRDRMVVFGGYDGANDLNDVWALSLAGTPAWTAVTPAGAPPSTRESHSAIYDPVRDRMVVFGGAEGSDPRNDAWALSLAGTPAWGVLTPTGTPPIARYRHSAIYDPLRDCMVVCRGTAGSSYANDVWALAWSPPVAVDPRVLPVPLRFELAPPRPNPARGDVSFDFAIPQSARVSLVVHDISGRLVRSIASAPFAAGRHTLVWDRRDRDGHVVPSGTYFVRFQAPGVLLTQKTMLIR